MEGSGGFLGGSKKEEIERGIKYDKNYCKGLTILGVLGVLCLISFPWILYHAYQAHLIFSFIGSIAMGILGLILVSVVVFCGIGYYRELKKDKKKFKK